MKVLFNPMGGSLAHTVRCFAIAEELKARNHSVFFTAPRNLINFIKKNNFEIVRDFEVVSFTDPEDQSLNYIANNKEKFIDWFKTEIDAADEIRPDVVVTAPGFLGSTIWHARQIPNVAIIGAPYTYKSKGILGLSLSDDSLRSRMLRFGIKPIFESKFYELYLKEVLDIYKELGISTSDINSRKDIQSFTKIIIPGDSKLEPLSDCEDSNIVHVGPVFWQGWENMESELSDDFILNFKDGKFLIAVFFGGSVHDKNIYDSVLNTFGDHLEDVRVIVGFGPNYKREDFPEDDENIIFSKYLPGLRVAKHADLVVNTGAQGGTSQALYHGKPVIAFPTNIDQSFYAYRLEELGVGINVNKANLLNFSKRETYANINEKVSERIVNAINKIRTDFSYREKAVTLSNFIKENYPNPIQESVSIIEKTV